RFDRVCPRRRTGRSARPASSPTWSSALARTSSPRACPPASRPRLVTAPVIFLTGAEAPSTALKSSLRFRSMDAQGLVVPEGQVSEVELPQLGRREVEGGGDVG